MGTDDFIVVDEDYREYVFPAGEKLEINDGVKSMRVSASGTHRINSNIGDKYIVPTGWLYIRFRASSWTF